VTHRAFCLHPLRCAPFSSQLAAPPTSPAAAFNPCGLGGTRGPARPGRGGGRGGQWLSPARSFTPPLSPPLSGRGAWPGCSPGSETRPIRWKATLEQVRSRRGRGSDPGGIEEGAGPGDATESPLVASDALDPPATAGQRCPGSETKERKRLSAKYVSGPPPDPGREKFVLAALVHHSPHRFSPPPTPQSFPSSFPVLLLWPLVVLGDPQLSPLSPVSACPHASHRWPRRPPSTSLRRQLQGPQSPPVTRSPPLRPEVLRIRLPGF
jgi:hypothetical protein